jgi:hypothetical protein
MRYTRQGEDRILLAAGSILFKWLVLAIRGLEMPKCMMHAQPRWVDPSESVTS